MNPDIWQKTDAGKIAVIGECMLELSEAGSGLLKHSFAGDTLNTATYLVRELKHTEHAVDYITAVGDDPFSDRMLEQWRLEGLRTKLVAQLPGKLPGLYWITTGTHGERSFYYWREKSAARSVLKNTTGKELYKSLSKHAIIYFSGISIAILDDDSRRKLLGVVRQLSKGGVLIIFDTNYREKLWRSPAEAKKWINRYTEFVDVAMVSFDDENKLFGDKGTIVTAERLHNQGVDEVVIKNSSKPCLVSTRAGSLEIPADKVVKPVDTTAAGDSFNAAYIAARIQGLPVELATLNGHKLAAKVIQFAGGILPRDNMILDSSVEPTATA